MSLHTILTMQASSFTIYTIQALFFTMLHTAILLLETPVEHLMFIIEVYAAAVDICQHHLVAEHIQYITI